MTRALLIAWFPWFGCLIAAAIAAWLVARASGARLAPARLRSLHRNEAGSIQTLSLVLTLPMFIMLVMFIVQVADLMMGIAVVHYAAFAAARAASVWIPAQVPSVSEAPNTFYPGSLDSFASTYPQWRTNELDAGSSDVQIWWKYRKIWSAAAMACTPISPSRKYFQGDDSPSGAFSIYSAAAIAMSPTLQRFPAYDRVIWRKANYAAANTRIVINGIDRDGTEGPTYNPYPGYYTTQIDPATGQPAEVWVPHNDLEVGWEDPLTVTVNHYFALMPGPGRFLSVVLSSPDGTRDDVSGLIVRPGQFKGGGFNSANKYQPYVQAVRLSASATISNEGLKSVMPYAQPND